MEIKPAALLCFNPRQLKFYISGVGVCSPVFVEFIHLSVQTV